MARPKASEWASYSKKQNSVNAFVLVSLVITLVAGFSQQIGLFISNFENSVPELKTPRASWLVLFPSTVDPAQRSGLNSSGKVPDLLWSSQGHLSDPDHFSMIRPPENFSFWVGLKLTAQDTKLILDRKALHFVIGHVNASYVVFVNGDYRTGGDGTDFLPASVPLVPADFSRPGGISIAVQIRQTLGSGRPIVVDMPIVNGFFTIERAKSLRDRWVFQTVTNPLSLALAALLSSIAFFSLWLSVRDRNEYFLFATYALVHFALQFASWGSIRSAVHRSVSYQIDTALGLLECCLAAMIGIAYARLRVGAYLMVIWAAAVFGVILYRSASAGSDFLYLSEIVQLYFGPVCFALSGFACFTQAAIGKRDGYRGMPKAKIQQRVARLNLFGWLILALGFFYYINAHRVITIEAFSYWNRPLQYGLITLMGLFLFRDYREFDVLQQKVATSRFHDPLAKEQKVVRGFLMALDLKKSSHLYDLSAQLGLAKKIPTQWCELATEIVELKGGAKISSAGDSLIAFFEGESEDVLLAVIAGLTGIQGLSKEFHQYAPEVHFRGGILKASIRPIYKKVSRKMYEDYEDGPGETGFKNLMRILDTEKGLGVSGKSLLVVEDGLSETVAKELELVKKQKLPVRDVGERELHYFDLAARAGRTERSEAA